MSSPTDKPDHRQKYWNDQYVTYWKNRVDEANASATAPSTIVAGDSKTTADRIYLAAIELLDIRPTDRILELGCGFGRSLPTLCRAGHSVSAVDISEEMIKIAKKENKENNVEYFVAPGEELPFPDNSFDVVVCFAAFDAMYQLEALIEMARVSKITARFLVTGKNDNYYDDDEAAHAAEIGARSKGHPNFFTDVSELSKNIHKLGLHIDVLQRYARRGDFAKGIQCDENVEKFYEYMLLLKKDSVCAVPPNIIIANDKSKTFLRRAAAIR